MFATIHRDVFCRSMSASHSYNLSSDVIMRDRLVQGSGTCGIKNESKFSKMYWSIFTNQGHHLDDLKYTFFILIIVLNMCNSFIIIDKLNLKMI